MKQSKKDLIFEFTYTSSCLNWMRENPKNETTKNQYNRNTVNGILS